MSEAGTSEKKDVVEQVDAKAFAELKASVDTLWAKVRRIVKYAELHFGKDFDKDGKVGSIRIWNALILALIAGGMAWATSDVVVWYSSDATKGTAKIQSDDAGACTLTVDKIVANTSLSVPSVSSTGALSVTEINPHSTTLKTSYDAVATLLKGTTIWNTESSVAQTSNNSYFAYELLRGYNSYTAATDYVELYAKATDTTQASTDGQLKFRVKIADTMTDVLTLDSSGATVALAASVAGAFSAPGQSALGNVSVNTNMVVSGTTVHSNTVTLSGANGDLYVGDDATVVDSLVVGGSSALTGTVTFTAIPVFAAAVGTAEAQTVTITNAPAGISTAAAKWIKIKLGDGTTNYFPCWQY